MRGRSTLEASLSTTLYLVVTVACDEARSPAADPDPADTPISAAPPADGAVPDGAVPDGAVPDGDLAPRDAGPEDPDTGEPAAGCRVEVARLDDAGVATGSMCLVQGPTGTCLEFVTCLCAFLVAPADQEHCVWALNGPRAMIGLGDYCNGSLSLAEALGRMGWDESVAPSFRVVPGEGCGALPAN